MTPFTDAMQVSIDQRIDKLRENLAYSPPELWGEQFEQCKAELNAHLFHNLEQHPLPSLSASLCRELWGPPGNRSLTCTMPINHSPHPTTLGHGFAGLCCSRYRIPGRTRDSVCRLPLGHDQECGS